MNTTRGLLRGTGRSWILLPAGLLSLLGYLLYSQLYLRTGFPLDDAWIHQTYARNLALLGEWSFIPGQPSAGSTSPLWTLLLAPGHLLGLGPFVWTFFLGWACLCGLAAASLPLVRRLAPGRAHLALWAGLLLVFDWRVVWAAASGMETLLYALVIVSFFALLLQERVRWLLLGLLVGLAVWIRPDGLTLSGPALMVLLSGEPDCQRRLRGGLAFLAGALAFFLPYLLFNQALAGEWWPNTFFAKQAEYAELRQIPLLERYAQQLVQPLVGAGALLLPGFVLSLRSGIRRRDWAALAGAIWTLGYLFVYAWRLPVTYQHGRYILPAVPVYLIWGMAGLLEWVRIDEPQMVRRVLSRAWVLGLALLLAVFWVQGAQTCARDVAVIETEMVDTARWVRENVPEGALVAAHDIGALGYFAGRPLLDLAGLISPEVIPVIRDEAGLAAFLDRHQAQYLVTFPGWYPQLTQQAELVFSTDGAFSPALGGENMAVYRWR